MSYQRSGGLPGSGTYPAILWQPNTAYTGGQIVVYLGVAYQAITSFTSGSSFNAANWTTLASTNTAASVEELTVSNLVLSAVAAAASYPIWVAPFAAKVTAAMFVNWNTDLTQDDTNFWTFALTRYRSNVAATIASITTKTTGSGGLLVTRRLGISFGGAAFDATNQQLSAGDILGLVVTPAGAPTGLNTFTLTAKINPQ